jgi:molecular chaperone GrpE
LAHEETTTASVEEGNSAEVVAAVEAAATNGTNDAAAAPTHPTPADSQPTSEEVTKLKAQVDEYLALAQRTRAEFANYKKRADREISESKQKGALDALSKGLPIIDDFERAMENIPADLQGNPWTNGVSLLLKKFEKLLNEHEVTALDPVGQPFDPTRHEAIGMDDSDTVASGHVTVTLQKGYISGDKVLRPALVRVAN